MFFQQEKKEEPKQQPPIALIMGLVSLFGYPFIITGAIFFFYLKYRESREKEEYGIDDPSYQTSIERNVGRNAIVFVVLTIINLLLMFNGLAEGYLSCYKILLNVPFNRQTLLALPLGTLGSVFGMLTVNGFISGRKVESIEERKAKIKKRTDYQERREDRLLEAQKHNREEEREYRYAKRNDFSIRLNELRNQIFLGIDEYGRKFYLKLLELCQHILIVGTTGAGKTVLLMNFVEHACKHNLPLVYLDGKGARETLEIVQKIAKKYGKTVKVFSDKDNLRYNPVKHGNSVAIRDRLVTLAKTESKFYTDNAKTLLMNTVQFIDYLEEPRIFQSISFYIDEWHVINKFRELLPAEKKLQKITPLLDDIGFVAKSEEVQEATKQRRNKKKKQESIEDVYLEVKSKKDLLPEKAQKLFYQMLEKYENKKEGAFFLYKNAETLQVNISMLIDSELGYLFDTSDENCEELDLLEVNNNNEIVFITLNGLVYEDYISMVGHFVITELNYMASEKYQNFDKSEFLLLADEPQSYLTRNAISSVNKGRGAGLSCIFSPQTLGDIESKEDGLLDLLIGNVNTFVVGQTNVPTEIEYLSKIAGTYKDLEKTSMVQQNAGLYDIGKRDFVAERGTMKDVDRFHIDPNQIRDLRTGEWCFHRKAANTRELPKVVYARKVS